MVALLARDCTQKNIRVMQSSLKMLSLADSTNGSD